MDKKKEKTKPELEKENRELREQISKIEDAFVEIRLELDSSRKRQNNLLSIINSTEDLFFILGLDGTFIRYYQSNDKSDLFLPPEKFLGKHFSDIFPKEVSEKLQKAINEVEDGKRSSCFEYSMEVRGKEQVFNAKITEFDSSGGKFFGFILGIKNTTEAKERMDLLSENEQKYRAIFAQSTEYVFLADIDTRRILEANKSVQNLLGYTRDEVRDLTLYDFLAVDQEDIYHEILDVLKKHSYFIGERKLQRKNGLLVDVEISVSIIIYSNRRVLCFVARDITPRKLAEKQLYHAATHDRLTGLINRLLFYDLLGKELARARRKKYITALIYIDLDNFKRVNDTRGHSSGDKLLIAVGSRLNALKRDMDTLARIGGDEYVLILPEIKNEKDVSKKATQILTELRKPFDIEDFRIEITASIGYSLFSKDGNSPESLIKAADIAMYYAKTHGRDRCKRYMPRLKGSTGRR
jgi:diguanylate cyclase (GGDEF)-like protein/PAS domain S-box-containing protein